MSDEVARYDDVVVGAGVIGSWTAYHLAKSGRKVLLLDQFPLPHTRGSSGGHSRIMKWSHRKQSYGDLVPDALMNWERLERECGIKLMLRTGCLTICERSTNGRLFEQLTSHLAERNQEYEVYRGEAISRAFPGLDFNEDYDLFRESVGVVFKADKCLRHLHDEFVKLGGTLHDTVKEVKVDVVNDRNVLVKTQRGSSYSAENAILACGAWANELTKKLDLNLPVESKRVVAHYWKEIEPELNPDKPKIPPILFYFSKYHLYSVSSYEYPGLVKMCYHYRAPTDPDYRDLPLSAEEQKKDDERFQILKGIVKKHFPFLAPESTLQETCIQTMTAGADFILDRHPMHRNVIIGTAGSGHAFGPSPVLGQILADLTTDHNKDTLGLFSIKYSLNTKSSL